MNFTKRADGRYQTKIYLGRDENNKKKYKYLYADTQKELEQLCLEVKMKKMQGIDIMSYDDTLVKWVERYKKIREEEINMSEFNVETTRLSFFVAEFGNTKLKDITDDDVRSAIKKLQKSNPTTGKPTAKKTLIYYNAALSRVFKYAMSKRVTTYNPCEFITISNDAPVSKRRALTEEEQKMIWDTPDKMQLPALFMMLTGLRRGEITALLWEDIDFGLKTVSVTKSYSFKQGIIKSTKTDAGMRTVPMPDKLVEYLKGINHTSDYVCPNSIGGHMYEGTWEKWWNNYLDVLDKKYGDKNNTIPGLSIARFTPHYLRHTYATMLYRAGIPVSDAKFLLGHSDIRTTMNIYTHLDEERQKSSVNKLNQLLSKK